MELCPKIWGVFHDATIVRIDGAVPGGVELSISDNELRQQFPDPGDGFRLRLESCTRLQFRPYSDTIPVVTDLADLARSELQILSADIREGYCEVHCQMLQGVQSIGALEVSAISVRLTLDSGREISLEEIRLAASSC